MLVIENLKSKSSDFLNSKRASAHDYTVGKTGYNLRSYSPTIRWSVFIVSEKVNTNIQIYLIHRSIYEHISILESFNSHILINLFKFFQYAKRQIIHSFECIWIYLLAIWESRPGGTVVKLVGTNESNYFHKKGQEYL